MTCPLVCPGEAEGRDPSYLVQRGHAPVPSLFSGCSFRLLGEARCPNVPLAIENGGGVVTDDDTGESSFIIVRLIRCVPSPNFRHSLI